MGNENQLKQEFAYHAIRDSIIKEEFAPNEFLSARVLCAQLGISRTPVIEALKRLSYEGFVDLHPNRGVTISTVSPHDAVEIHQLREGLEGVAARMCAVNHPEDIILQMEQCLDENAEAFLSGQYSKAIGFDNKFHTLLVAGSGNARMIQITEGILHQSGRANFLQATAAARMKRSAVQHRNILRAIKKSDPDLAEKYAREHMRDVQRFILMYQKTHEV